MSSEGGAKSSPRSALPEALRILGAIAVVIGHADLARMSYAIAAVGVFFGISIGFAVSAPARSRRVSQLATRLLVPWLFWSVIYAALQLTECVMAGRFLTAWFQPWMVLTGTSVHLWYLPAAFVGSIALLPIAHRCSRMRLVWRFSFALGAFALSAVAWLNFLEHVVHQATPPLGQWRLLLASGLGAASWCVLTGVTPPRRWIALVGAATLVPAFALFAAQLDRHTSLFFIGIGSAAATQVAKPHAGPLLRQLASLTLGVYLFHPIVLAFGRRVSLTGIPAAIFACIVSFTLIGLVRRVWPTTQRVTG